LFVVTADHGMAPQDVSLRANPAALVRDAGLAAVVAEPMIWLLDAAVTIERQPDRRTARVLVADDAGRDGERPPIAGASIVVQLDEDGSTTTQASGTTDDAGVFGFATPSHLDDDAFTLTITAPGKNARRVRLDGTNDAIDLRASLYGATPSAHR
jgi:hypothetical protein